MQGFEKVKEALKEGCFHWSKHALDKISMYGYDEDDVLKEVLETGELIEYHYWHDYGEKFLVYVNSKDNGTYHVVIINTEVLDIIMIKTVYKPDNTFKADMKTRSDGGRVL